MANNAQQNFSAFQFKKAIFNALLDANLGLIFAHSLRIVPMVTWILVGNLTVIPRALKKAAFVDGRDKICGLAIIIMPLALPGIAVAAIFGFFVFLG